MLDTECIYDCSDDDCNKCIKHGIILSCSMCEDFTTYNDVKNKETVED